MVAASDSSVVAVVVVDPAVVVRTAKKQQENIRKETALRYVVLGTEPSAAQQPKRTLRV